MALPATFEGYPKSTLLVALGISYCWYIRMIVMCVYTNSSFVRSQYNEHYANTSVWCPVFEVIKPNNHAYGEPTLTNEQIHQSQIATWQREPPSKYPSRKRRLYMKVTLATWLILTAGGSKLLSSMPEERI